MVTIRLIQLFERFLLSVNQIGVLNSLLVFSYLIDSRDRVVSIQKDGRKFNFCPKSDKGVISHFYKTGYRIQGKVELVFDVGSNIGDETFRFRHFHPEAKIVSVEPSSRNFNLLYQNFNEDPNVFMVNGALWNVSGELEIRRRTSHESYSIDGVNDCENFSNGSEKVLAYSVHDLINRFGLQDCRIDVFKIDVEGAEEFIFCGDNNDWIDLVNVLIMEMPDSDRGGSFQRILNTFSRMDVWGSSFICGENYIFIRDGYDFVLEKVIGFG